MERDFKIEFSDSEFNRLYSEYLKQQEKFNIIAKEKINIYKKDLTKIINEYKPDCKALYDDAVDKVIKSEFAVKGETLYRGYYCPSPILDIVVGNINRGKILKRVSVKSKPTYEYGFDDQGKLVLVKHLYNEEFDNIGTESAEVILHRKNSIIGILINLDKGGEITIEAVSESIYDEQDRIESFSYGYIGEKGDIYELSKEIYSYDNEGLKTSEVYLYEGSGYSFYKYTFEHDSEGYLREYTAEPSMFSDNKYKVYLKRKV